MKEGVALKLSQTRNLFDAIETIDAAADEEWKTLEGQKAEYLVHLGYGTFLKVYLYNGLRYYDVRRYWRPPTQYDAVPTKTGLNMNKSEFEKLRSVREAMFTALPQLHEVLACDCITQGNQLASLRCVECNPFHNLDY